MKRSAAKGQGRAALVMGLGSFGGGVGAARYLAEAGWQVCVTDLRDEAGLAQAKADLSDLPIRYVLGEHREADFQGAELVVANPAVAPDHALLEMARSHGARVSSEIELFLEGLRSRLVLVTGTQGKSSTCHLLAQLLRECGERVFLGGNIGVSLLGELPNIGPNDIVVLELSSYQLEALSMGAADLELCPADAVCVTNLVPDHLERHGTLERYGEAKRHILKLLGEDGVALIGDSSVLAQWQPPRGKRLTYGLAGTELCLQEGQFQMKGERLAQLSSLGLPGDFQRINALAALGLAASLGLAPAQLDLALQRAQGLEHRLQCLGEVDGLRIHDNAVSTTPDSTIAALLSLPRGAHLMMGGRSKGLALGELARVVHERASGVTLFGEAREELAEALAAEGVSCTQFEALESAVDGALASCARPADLLFSPACSSFDAFPNFKARARAFRARLPLPDLQEEA